MKSFIHQVVAQLEQTGQPFSQMQLVFPGKRAGLFFRKALAEKISKPIWLPEILSIEEFVNKETGLNPADDFELIFRMYRLYRAWYPEEPFDRFFGWGAVILRDFDECDKALAHPEDLFRTIRRLGELDSLTGLAALEPELYRLFWQNFYNREPEEFQKDFLKTWEILGGLYRDFRQDLLAGQLSYSGLAERRLAEDPTWPGKETLMTVFCGFNALTRAEERILEKALSAGKALVFWDADDWYLNRPEQEAGLFLRQWKEKPAFAGTTFFSENLLAETERQVTVINCAQNLTQAIESGAILEENLASGKMLPDQTVVALPDEQLLFPVLQNLPPDLTQVNVTMGLSLSNTPVYTLLESCFYLFQNAWKNAGHWLYSFADAEKILAHPLIMQLQPEAATGLQEQLKNWKKSRFSRSDFEGEIPEFFALLFEPVQQGTDFVFCLKKLLAAMPEEEPSQSPLAQITREILNRALRILVRLDDLLHRLEQTVSPAFAWSLLRQMLQSQRVSFSGEPLSGLQIMGFLETRNLDFANVFVLSVNEDVLPASAHKPSFIPWHLKKAFGMALPDHQDSIYAYNFYRLLQRSRQAFLFYSSDKTGSHSGERSRFLAQIELELARANPALVLKNHQPVYPLSLQHPPEISIAKNEDIMEFLHSWTGQTPATVRRAISPSALTVYLACRLKFYFQFVAGIKEPQAIEDEADAALMGTIFHDTLEALYLPRLNKVLVEADFEEMHRQIPEIIAGAWQKNTGLTFEQIEGKNLLIHDVMVKGVEKILQKDREDALSGELLILHLEAENLEIHFPVQIGEEQRFIGIGGKIDRVDQYNGRIRILDYKTGKIGEGTGPKELKSLFENNNYKEMRQTLLYALLFAENSRTEKEITTGIYSIRSGSKPLKMLFKGEPLGTEMFHFVREGTTAVLSEIFDPETDFSQTSALKECEYCPYNGICQR